jgi:hypothetical protein
VAKRQITVGKAGLEQLAEMLDAGTKTVDVRPLGGCELVRLSADDARRLLAQGWVEVTA